MTTCPECNDTGERDSGGTHPWGEPVYLPCDCKNAEIGRRWHEDELTTLKRIADLAHAGGHAMLTEAETLVAIRRLSLPYWNKKRLTDPMQMDVLAALRAANAAPVA